MIPPREVPCPPMNFVAECYNISGEYRQFVLRILGELDCIGGLNSCFVMGEVKNICSVPVREPSAL
ncbi:MAG: hypothetical protein ACI3ZC_04445 [Candidatus Cryptobacteroides sp.]